MSGPGWPPSGLARRRVVQPIEAAAQGGAAATRRGVATGSGQNGNFRQWGGHLASDPLGGSP
nr:MAG TPA: hypothetical protein [Caudoviricetes sp.]